MRTTTSSSVQLAMPTRYFSLRSRLGPPPSRIPAVVVGILALVTIAGAILDIAKTAL